MKQRLIWLVIPGIAGILLLSLWPSQQVTVCTFDQGQILRSFTEQLIAHEISDESAEAKTRQFAEALKKALDDYAKTKHVIVLDKSKVLAAWGCDVTTPVKSLVSKNMRGEL